MTQGFMMPNNLKTFNDDVKDIIKKYRAEAAISLNQTIIHERDGKLGDASLKRISEVSSELNMEQISSPFFPRL